MWRHRDNLFTCDVDTLYQCAHGQPKMSSSFAKTFRLLFTFSSCCCSDSLNLKWVLYCYLNCYFEQGTLYIKKRNNIISNFLNISIKKLCRHFYICILKRVGQFHARRRGPRAYKTNCIRIIESYHNFSAYRVEFIGTYGTWFKTLMLEKIRLEF